MSNFIYDFKDGFRNPKPEDVPLWFEVILFIAGLALLIVKLSWVAVIGVFLLFWSTNISLAREIEAVRFRAKSDYVTKKRFGVIFEDLTRYIEKIDSKIESDYVPTKSHATDIKEITLYVQELKSRIEELELKS